MTNKFNIGDSVWFFCGGELLKGSIMGITKERDCIEYGITRGINSSCREFDRKESRVFKDVVSALHYQINCIESEMQMRIKDLHCTLDQIKLIIEKEHSCSLSHPPKTPHPLDGNDCQSNATVLEEILNETK